MGDVVVVGSWCHGGPGVCRCRVVVFRGGVIVVVASWCGGGGGGGDDVMWSSCFKDEGEVGQ